MVSCGRMGRGGADVAAWVGVADGGSVASGVDEAGGTVAGAGEVEAGVHPPARMAKMRISWIVRICFFISLPYCWRWFYTIFKNDKTSMIVQKTKMQIYNSQNMTECENTNLFS